MGFSENIYKKRLEIQKIARPSSGQLSIKKAPKNSGAFLKNKIFLFYLETLSSHFNMKIMVNMEIRHATTNTVQVNQIGMAS